jgi:murein DD-endopeptidase MepM/ murein hydrolase activator NlpD
MRTDVAEKLSLLTRFKAKAIALFPNHQIYFRTDGKVRFFTLTTRMQLAGVAALCMSFIWLGKSTYDYIAQSDRLQANRVALNKMSGQMEELSDDFEGLEQRILERAARIEARQGVLQSVLNDGLVDAKPIDLQTLTDDALSSTSAKDGDSPQKEASAYMIRKPGADPQEHFQTVFTILEKRQIAFATALQERAQTEKDDILTLLSNLNVDPEIFLATAQDHGADAIAANVGGPFVALSSLEEDDTPEPFTALIEDWAELKDLRDQILSVPAIAPLDKYYVSSKYGKRRDPFSRRWAHHSGVDLAAWYGTPIHATSDGKVTYAGYKAGYGRVVEIDHGNGFVTRYGHLRKVVVKKGQSVTMKTKLGETGSTGRSTGPHVHYEIWFNGKTVNPVPFIKASNDVLKIQGRSTRG